MEKSAARMSLPIAELLKTRPGEGRHDLASAENDDIHRS
jgi:hypothetical protein